MASSIHANLTSLHLRPLNLRSKTPPEPPNAASVSSIAPIRCGGGPRSNRGALVKGRVLSTEAILAVQSLKRAYKSPPSNRTNLPNLSRLIKSDLVAILRELLRQDLCSLALHVLSTLRSEFSDHADLNLYADVISALSRNGMFDQVDRLIGDLEEDEGGIRWASDKGLVRVVKGVVEARRRESTVRICEMMRRSGCGDTWTADEYVVKSLSRGLRRMGEDDLADEAEREFEGLCKGNLGKLVA